MSTMIPPTHTEQSPDEIDALLRAFFQAQMPKPWPAFKAPQAPSAQAGGGWWARSRSRLALAASVAILLLGSWWLAGRSADYATPIKGVSTELGNATGGTPAHLKNKKVDEKPALPANP